jgi:hypothetical protein
MPETRCGFPTVHVSSWTTDLLNPLEFYFIPLPINALLITLLLYITYF